MPKKAAATEDKTVSKAAFLKGLASKRAVAKAAAKSERPAGILNDQAILEKLGIKSPSQSVTLNGKVSKIQPGYAKQDKARPYFRFAYILAENSPLSGKGKGTILSNYHELTEAAKDGEIWRTEEEAYQKMYWEFQSLGEDTASWDDPLSDAADAAERYTKDKTDIAIQVSAYEKRNGTLGMNVEIVSAASDNSDLEDEEEGEEEEGTEEEEFDPNDWIDCWVTWEDDEGSVDVKLTAYEDETFTGVNEDGDEYEGIPFDQIEYIDPQPE